ncbi:MAG: hypothetical protein WC966_11925, partial [Bradymonadales bacterium]
DNRQVSSSTRRIIEFNLNKLKEFGGFLETKLGKTPAWQPTRRYNVLVQELAASRLFEKVNHILNKERQTDTLAEAIFQED